MKRAWVLGLLLMGLPMRMPAQDALHRDRHRLRACVDSCSSAISAGQAGEATRQAEEALRIAEALHDSTVMAEVLVKLGSIHMMQDDYSASLGRLQRALRIYEALDDDAGKANVYNSIGSIHYYDHNYDRALFYYHRSLAIQQRLGNRSEVATVTGNLGSVLDELGRPDSALAYHRRHLAMRRSLGQQGWIPICYSNLGMCFDKLGAHDSALHYLEASVAMHPRNGRKNNSLSYAMTMLGVARLNAGQLRQAARDCRESLAFSERLNDMPMVVESCRCLYRAYQALGDAPNALAMYERYIATRDSMSGEQRAKELLRMELYFQFENERLADSLQRVDEQRRAEYAYLRRLTKERDQKRIFLFGGIGVLLVAGGLWSRLRYIQRSRRLVQQERDRSDGLLRNILPAAVADELKQKGEAQAREVEGVSILFTDFHAFTQLSERLSPQELVAEIHACFKAFDRIAARHGLEKIKTIGDAYMCAGGLPYPREGSARDTVLAALEMQRWLKDHAQRREREGLPSFRMRAGIHTGPVVAGIVGESKFQYDVWGDTVNTAARMESAGAVDEVNISEATFNLVKDEPGLRFSPRGRIEAKGKGELAMFFVGHVAAGDREAFADRAMEQR